MIKMIWVKEGSPERSCSSENPFMIERMLTEGYDLFGWFSGDWSDFDEVVCFWFPNTKEFTNE